MQRSFAPSGNITESEKVSSQLANELQLEKLYFRLKAEEGVESKHTLDIFFQLFDVWIGLYRCPVI